MTLKVTVTEDVSNISISGNTTSINLTGEQTEISVVNPAATVTYNPTSPFTATNVQDALPQAYKMIGEQVNNFPIKLNHFNDFQIGSGNNYFKMNATGSQFGWQSLLWASDDITIRTHNNIDIAEFRDTRIHFNKQIEMQGIPTGNYQEGFLNTDSSFDQARHHIRCKANGTPVAYLGGINVSEPTAFFGSGGTSIAIQSSFLSGDIFPASLTGGNRDALVNLGKTDSRFKDLYLSDNLYADGVSFEDANITFTTDQFTVNNAGGNSLITTTSQGVNLKYNGVQKLATTTTGIDVTGTAAMDGLSVDGTSDLNGNLYIGTADTGVCNFVRPSTNYIRANETNGSIAMGVRDKIRLFTGQASGEYLTKERLRIDTNGDISFYEDTGTTPKFFWDASEECLGIGTTSPDYTLDIEAETAQARIHSTVGNSVLRLDSVNDGESKIYFADNSAPAIGTIEYHHNTNHMSFSTLATTRMLINSTGNVGIGTSSPTGSYTKALHIHGSGTGASLHLTDPTSGATASDGLEVFQYGTDGYIWEREAGNLRFGTSATERMRIDSAGHVGIGTSSPATRLDVKSKYSYQSASNGAIRIRNHNVDQFGSIFHIAGTQIVDNASYYTGGQHLAKTTFSSNINLASGTIKFYTNGGLTADTAFTPMERMRIESSGNVGIGTSSPDTLLNIASSSAPTVRIENTDTSLSEEQVVGAIEFFSNDPSGNSPNVTGYIETRAADSFGSGGNMVFATGALGNSAEGERAIERMRIDSSGNLLVGTTSQFTGGSKASTTVTVDGSVGRKGNRFDDFDDVWSSGDAVIIEGVSNFNPSNSPNGENWYFVKAVTLNTGASNVYCTQTVTTLTGKIFTRYNNDVVGSGSWTSWVEK
jgi:hypothetical protein